jgi:hypothetical protein
MNKANVMVVIRNKNIEMAVVIAILTARDTQ